MLESERNDSKVRWKVMVNNPKYGWYEHATNLTWEDVALEVMVMLTDGFECRIEVDHGN